MNYHDCPTVLSEKPTVLLNTSDEKDHWEDCAHSFWGAMVGTSTNGDISYWVWQIESIESFLGGQSFK
jgi:hypothetical protein